MEHPNRKLGWWLGIALWLRKPPDQNPKSMQIMEHAQLHPVYRYYLCINGREKPLAIWDIQVQCYKWSKMPLCWVLAFDQVEKYAKPGVPMAHHSFIGALRGQKWRSSLLKKQALSDRWSVIHYSISSGWPFPAWVEVKTKLITVPCSKPHHFTSTKVVTTAVWSLKKIWEEHRFWTFPKVEYTKIQWLRHLWLSMSVSKKNCVSFFLPERHWR